MAVNWWALHGYFNSAAINDACAKLRELSLRSAGGASHFYQINSGIFYAMLKTVYSRNAIKKCHPTFANKMADIKGVPHKFTPRRCSA